MPDEHDTGCSCKRGVTRRGFISSVSAGAVAAATLGRTEAAPAAAAAEAGDLVPCTLNINGRRHALQVEARWSLLYVVRDRLGLTATKIGCERGECGACTVLVDDVPHYACMVLALEAQGRKITTLEGLMRGEELGTVQQAFVEEDAFQCGYCTPGQIMAAEGLLRAVPQPSNDEIRTALSGNLCRCGAYDHIRRAVGRAAELRRTGGA